jgi:hypothetical protein
MRVVVTTPVDSPRASACSSSVATAPASTAAWSDSPSFTVGATDSAPSLAW